MNEENRWAAGSLVIASETMGIDDISAVLQLTPDRSWTKGSPYSPGNPESRLRTNNVWVRTNGLDSEEPFLDHIAELLADLEPRRRELEQLAGKCVITL